MSRFKPEKYTKLFDKAYSTASRNLAASPIAYNAQWELLPLLYAISEFAVLCEDKDSEIPKDILRPYIEQKHIGDTASKHKFLYRIFFYHCILKGDKLRAEWLFGNAEIAPKSFVSACCIAFGDILVNPGCIDDYEKAPIALHGITYIMDFTRIMFEHVMPDLTDYALSVNKLCQKNSRGKR